MESTLIIGNLGVGKTTLLKELLNKLPTNIHIALCDKYFEDIRHHEKFNLQETDIEPVLTRLIGKKPSLLVIDEVDFYDNLSIPSNVPVFATMQAQNIEQAQESLKRKNIEVDFQRVILLENKKDYRMETTRLIPIGTAKRHNGLS